MSETKLEMPRNKDELLRLTDETVVYWANSDAVIAKRALEVMVLRYDNLIRCVINNQRDLRYTEEDKKDVKANIYKHFIVRIRNFNPSRKIPFAGYIKRMLNQDVMNEYGGKKNASGNIGLRSSFCRKWANEINFSDYASKVCGDEYDLEDLDIVIMNASSDFTRQMENATKKMENDNDLNRLWREVKRILSKKKFLVLYYYYKEGLSEREIGELLNIKQNTVSGHKTDAESRLKKSRSLKAKFNFKDFIG